MDHIDIVHAKLSGSLGKLMCCHNDVFSTINNILKEHMFTYIKWKASVVFKIIFNVCHQTHLFWLECLCSYNRCVDPHPPYVCCWQKTFTSLLSSSSNLCALRHEIVPCHYFAKRIWQEWITKYCGISSGCCRGNGLLSWDERRWFAIYELMRCVLCKSLTVIPWHIFLVVG